MGSLSVYGKADKDRAISEHIAAKFKLIFPKVDLELMIRALNSIPVTLAVTNTFTNLQLRHDQVSDPTLTNHQNMMTAIQKLAAGLPKLGTLLTGVSADEINSKARGIAIAPNLITLHQEIRTDLNKSTVL